MKNNYTITPLEDILKVARDAGYTSDFTREELEESFSEEKQYKGPLFNHALVDNQSNNQ